MIGVLIFVFACVSQGSNGIEPDQLLVVVKIWSSATAVRLFATAMFIRIAVMCSNRTGTLQSGLLPLRCSCVLQ